jgi:Zn-dependent protease with chaperone function
MVAVEHFLLLSTALASLSFAVAWMVHRLAGRRRSVHPHSLATLYAVALTGPPAIAAWLVATAFVPAWWLSEPAFDVAHAWPLHDLHLLAGVLGNAERPLAVASVVLLAALGAALGLAGLRGRAAVRRALDVLRDRPGPLDEKKLSDVTILSARIGLGLRLIPARYPVAFIWGIRRTTFVVSSGLLVLLTPDEVRAVLAHEGAHHARRDNLGRLLLLICAYASLAMPLSRRILTWYEAQAELVCDEIAARATRAPLDLASALVSIRRSTVARPSRPLADALVTSALAPHGQTGFEQRVRRLVALSETTLDDRARLTRSFWPLASLGLLAFGVTVGAVTLCAPLATHHAIEACLRFLG